MGQGGGNGGVSESDPNLVAYWKFDEGQGYLVKDATGKGHDMRLTSQPNWMVRLLGPASAISDPQISPVPDQNLGLVLR